MLNVTHLSGLVLIILPPCPSPLSSHPRESTKPNLDSALNRYDHDHDSTYKIHLRAARAYLGLPKNVASPGLISELDWLIPQYQTQAKMIRHFGHILKTDDNRLLKKIYVWDKYLNESKKIVSWSSEVKSILYDNSLNHVYDAQQIFQVKTIVNQLKGCLFDKQQVLIENECKDKPKLRTFITLSNTPIVGGSNMYICVKLQCIEGRFNNIVIKIVKHVRLRPK